MCAYNFTEIYKGVCSYLEAEAQKKRCPKNLASKKLSTYVFDRIKRLIFGPKPPTPTHVFPENISSYLNQDLQEKIYKKRARKKFKQPKQVRLLKKSYKT